MTTPGTNRHPVDELADVRAEMRRLKEREAELRTMIIEDRCTHSGAEFAVDIRTSEQERVDTAAVWREFGIDVLRARKLVRTVEFKFVKLRSLTPSEAARTRADVERTAVVLDDSVDDLWS